MIQFLQSIREIVGPVLDAMPNPVFIVDEDVRIIGLNKASKELIGNDPKVIIKRRAGEILHCIHSYETIEGCGRSEFCSDCMIRNSVNKAFRKKLTSKEKAKVEIATKDGIQNAYLSIISAPFEYKDHHYVLLQLENITEIIELRKILPICSICHDIRNDNEYWHKIESYLDNHLDLKFSHSICPKCAKKNYPDYELY